MFIAKPYNCWTKPLSVSKPYKNETLTRYIWHCLLLGIAQHCILYQQFEQKFCVFISGCNGQLSRTHCRRTAVAGQKCPRQLLQILQEFERIRIFTHFEIEIFQMTIIYPKFPLFRFIFVGLCSVQCRSKLENGIELSQNRKFHL